MTSSLLFEFNVNKAARTVKVVKEFAAAKATVWDCWTKPELLDKWWAPLPYVNQTISMNFAEGGAWHYAMISPEGNKHFCKAKYEKIVAQENYSYRDAFCDEQGVESDMPNMHWVIAFSGGADAASVAISIDFVSEEALENIIKMGFKEGFTAAIQQLDALMETL